MKLKKFLAGVGTLCLVLTLLLPLQVHAQENTGSTTITTRVPDTHIVLLDIGEHGSVFIGGKTYTSKDKQVEVSRLAEQTYIIQPGKGWQIETVLYGQVGTEEQVMLSKDTFTAPAINSNDNKLTVTFQKNSVSNGANKENTDTPDKYNQTGINAKTGDTANIFLWFALIGVSGLGVFILIRYNHKRQINYEEYSDN